MARADPILASQAGILSLSCPECGLRLDVATSGLATCKSCSTRYTAVVFKPPQEQGPEVLPSTSGAPCAQHARNLAIDSCARCGSFICALCSIDLEGQQICPKCFDRAQEAAASTNSRLNYNSLGFVISLVGLPMIALGMIIGPIAIYYCIRGGIRNARLKEDVSRIPGLLGVVLGLLETVVGIIIVVALLSIKR